MQRGSSEQCKVTWNLPVDGAQKESLDAGVESAEIRPSSARPAKCRDLAAEIFPTVSSQTQIWTPPAKFMQSKPDHIHNQGPRSPNFTKTFS